MKINTRDFGEMQIDDNTILEFVSGIIGFEDTKKYTLISPLGEDKFPMWLQSVEDTQPCFVVYDPMQIYPDYSFEITDAEMQALRISEDTPYRCLTVAIVPDNYRKTTINLRCPIIINTKENLAAQVMLQEDYEFTAPVYAEEV